MKKLYTVIIFCCLCTAWVNVSAQTTVRGKVLDAETGEDLVGASIALVDGSGGALTNYEGEFVLKVASLPAKIKISYTGFNTEEITVTDAAARLNVKLSTNAILIAETTVVGQRIDEKQKAAPLTIENLDAIGIKQSAAVSFYNSLGNLKGVDLTTASLGFTIINTRGFNSTSPVRSLQIIDGVDNQAPGLNFSLGNFLGSSDLDVIKVDLVQGASSAFYGPNAFNGVISMETKNPFIHKGLSVSQKIGERSLYEGAIRMAGALKNKAGKDWVAGKLNFFYLRAYDWVADNYEPVFDSESPGTNPGRFDAVNVYGDEYQALMDQSSSSPWDDFYGMQTYHRTGYREIDLVDYNTRNTKANASVHIRTNPSKEFESPELILSSSFGSGTTVYQGDNRFSLRNILFFQNRIEFRQKDKFFLRAYATNEDAGNSYDPYFSALRLQEAAKSNRAWASDYSRYWTRVGRYQNRMVETGYPALVFDPNTFTFAFDNAAAERWFAANQSNLTEWHQKAEAYSNQKSENPTVISTDFFQPGTPRFQQEFDRIRAAKSGRDGGTRFFDKSGLYHLHGEYRFKPKWLSYWVVGGNGRIYRPYSEGTIFSDTLRFTRNAQGVAIDSEYTRITNTEFGAYTGIEKKFIDNKLIFNATIRVDKNQNFNLLATPALSLVYNPNKTDYLRVSFSSAIRNPTLTDQYLNLNVGRAILLGNLQGFKNLVTVESFREGVEKGNFTLFKYFDAPPIQPEKVRTIEFGYRTTLWRQLYVDAGYYYSRYTDFIGFNIGVFAPIAAGQLDLGRLQAYRIAANSTNQVTTQGFNLGLNYYFNTYYMLAGNYSWNRLNKLDVDDPIIPAFNTPEHKFNVSFSGRDVPMLGLKRTGFNVTYKWIQGFLFEGSPQFTGFIPTYDMVDVQWNVSLDKLNTTIKIGAANLFGLVPLREGGLSAAFNNRQYQTYGGPRIGRMAYLSVIYDFVKK